jgi:hypothetical protein
MDAAMPSLRLALTGAAAALAVAAPSVSAAGNPYTPTGVCGAGYRVIDHHDLRGPKGGLLATTYLLWNGGAKKNCAVTIKRRAVGVPTFVEVSLYKKGGNYNAEGSLDYKYYAGPLYVKAPGQCVFWGGRMSDAKGRGDSWITPYAEHCK